MMQLDCKKRTVLLAMTFDVLLNLTRAFWNQWNHVKCRNVNSTKAPSRSIDRACLVDAFSSVLLT